MTEHTYKTCLCEGCKIYRKEKGIFEPVSAYDAEVRRIAELLAQIHHDRTSVHDTGYKFKEYSKPSQQSIAKKFIPEARAMVVEMDKVFILGALGSNKLEEADHFIQDAVNAERIKRGLIPSPENKQI